MFCLFQSFTSTGGSHQIQNPALLESWWKSLMTEIRKTEWRWTKKTVDNTRNFWLICVDSKTSWRISLWITWFWCFDGCKVSFPWQDFPLMKLMMLHSFSHSHGSGKLSQIKGKYYWRDPCSMIMEGKVTSMMQWSRIFVPSIGMTHVLLFVVEKQKDRKGQSNSIEKVFQGRKLKDVWYTCKTRAYRYECIYLLYLGELYTYNFTVVPFEHYFPNPFTSSVTRNSLFAPGVSRRYSTGPSSRPRHGATWQGTLVPAPSTKIWAKHVEPTS